MNRQHASPVQSERIPSATATMKMAAINSTGGVSARATQRVRECKAKLFRALQRRHRDAWRSYWTAFQQYLLAKLSIHEFQATAESLLGAENIMLHNAFVVALMQDCSDPGEMNDVETEHDTGGSSTGSSETSMGGEQVDVKTEPHAHRHADVLDTESAELLMGLGRSTSR